MTGALSWSAFFASSRRRSWVASTVSAGRALTRSILLTTMIGIRPSAIACRSTTRVCGTVPSSASTSSREPPASPAGRLGKEVEAGPGETFRLFHLRGVSTVLEDNDLSADKLVLRRLGVARRKDVVVPSPDQERRHAQLGEPVLDANATSKVPHSGDRAGGREVGGAVLRRRPPRAVVAHP